VEILKQSRGDSGHARADMVTEVYGHIIDEDRRKKQREWRMPFIIRKILIRIYMSRKRKIIRLLYRREQRH